MLARDGLASLACLPVLLLPRATPSRIRIADDVTARWRANADAAVRGVVDHFVERSIRIGRVAPASDPAVRQTAAGP